MHQQLTLPVGSCFLLPGQSASWQRPLRILESGYEAQITWREVPKDAIATSMWYESGKTTKPHSSISIYEPLTEENEVLYSNICAARETMPYVILAGDFEHHAVTCLVKCVMKRVRGIRDPKALEGFPEGSVEFSLLNPISSSIVVTKDKVVFRRYNRSKRAYETRTTPDIEPIAIDFIFYRYRNPEKNVPCILDPEEFKDMIDVKRPERNRFYQPGITQVPLDLFPQILARARDRKLPIRLRTIDPNSLGKRHVLTIGIEVSKRGRQQEDRTNFLPGD